MRLVPVRRWKSHNWKTSVQGAHAKSAFAGGTCGQFPKVFYGYLLGTEHRLTAKRTFLYICRAAFLPLAFSLCIACGGSCGVVVEVVEVVLRAMANASAAPGRCFCGRRGSRWRNR